VLHRYPTIPACVGLVNSLTIVKRSVTNYHFECVAINWAGTRNWQWSHLNSGD
jgi:hypothetical protein